MGYIPISLLEIYCYFILIFSLNFSFKWREISQTGLTCRIHTGPISNLSTKIAKLYTGKIKNPYRYSENSLYAINNPVVFIRTYLIIKILFPSIILQSILPRSNSPEIPSPSPTHNKFKIFPIPNNHNLNPNSNSRRD